MAIAILNSTLLTEEQWDHETQKEVHCTHDPHHPELLDAIQNFWGKGHSSRMVACGLQGVQGTPLL